MTLENEYLDVLQNIEFAIVSIYREHNDLRDREVMLALDALIDRYRAEARGHTPKEPALSERVNLVFQRVNDMCEFRLGRKDIGNDMPVMPGEEITASEVLSCLRKIRKSVERWNKKGGQQGYLKFVREYVK